MLYKSKEKKMFFLFKCIFRDKDLKDLYFLNRELTHIWNNKTSLLCYYLEQLLIYDT